MKHPRNEPWLDQAARKRVLEFTTQLRTVSDTTVLVPGLDWTVADLAQHVASLASHFHRLHDDGAGFEQPTDFVAFSDERRAHITETDAERLADLIDTELGDYVDVLSDSEGRWLYGIHASAGTLAALLLSEAVLHGRDLAGVTGAAKPMFDRREANAVVDATMVATPAFIDAAKTAKQPDGVYHIKFRGGNDYTWTKTGADLVVSEGKPRGADAHLNADPGMFMLSSLGRVSQVHAALSGKLLTYGMKPWRFIGLGNVVIDGV